MMALTLGLGKSQVDENYLSELDQTMRASDLDMTIFFRELAKVSFRDQPKEAKKHIDAAFYGAISEENTVMWIQWFEKYLMKLKDSPISQEDRTIQMNAVNPKYVLRNYMAQTAIDQAEKGEYNLIYELYNLLKNPYDEQPDQEIWYKKRPNWARNKVGCSALSCSS